MAEEERAEDAKKSPRGIRFYDDDYEKLQKETRRSRCHHLDEYIMKLIRTQKSRLRMDKLVETIIERQRHENEILLKQLVMIFQEVANENRKLLDRFQQLVENELRRTSNDTPSSEGPSS